MNNQLIFKDEIIHYFDFNHEYIGYVIDNSEFESFNKIKVFIPELFGHSYNPNIINFEKNVNISLSHILNKSDLNVNTSITRQEYIYAKILPNRHYLHNKEEFINHYKPEIGDTVIVSFFNGNPNNCIYDNKVFIADEMSNINNNTKIEF